MLLSLSLSMQNDISQQRAGRERESMEAVRIVGKVRSFFFFSPFLSTRDNITEASSMARRRGEKTAERGRV